MALNKFHNDTIPRNSYTVPRIQDAALVKRNAHVDTFYTAFSSGKTQHKAVINSSEDAKANAQAYATDLLKFGLLTAAVLFVIYRR